jgi:hypothetical protein
MRAYPILLLIVGLFVSACDDPAGPSTGLVVSTSTTGEDPDQDGYLLTVDAGDSVDLDPTGRTMLDLEPGRHDLRLLNVADQCFVAPGPSLTVEIQQGRTKPVAFDIRCPATQARITVTTAGLTPDQDGYLLTVDDADSLPLDPTATAEVELAPGRHTLRMLGVSDECSIVPGSTVELDVLPGRTIPVAFEVNCSTGASIAVVTTGLDFDPDGYGLVVDGGDHGRILANTNLLTTLGPGSRTIAVTGVAPNCALDGPASRTVTIVTGEVVPIRFAVVCVATSGVIGISLSGTGPTATLASFEVAVDGARHYYIKQRPVYVRGVAAGDHLVSLGVPSNCVVEPDSHAVTVTAGTLTRDTVEVTFSVDCVIGLQVTAPTTGPIPRSKYRVYLCGDFYCDHLLGSLGEVAPNDTLIAQVDPGRYWPILGNLARNCHMELHARHEIRVVPGALVSVELPVVCR